jgi:hypothetical protein
MQALQQHTAVMQACGKDIFRSGEVRRKLHGQRSSNSDCRGQVTALLRAMVAAAAEPLDTHSVTHKFRDPIPNTINPVAEALDIYMMQRVRLGQSTSRSRRGKQRGTRGTGSGSANEGEPPSYLADSLSFRVAGRN